MYRAPDETPRCACCHSVQLTEITKFDPTEGYSRVHFALREKPPGLFSDPMAHYQVNRARVCLACGHVMLFLDTAQRAELAERISTLAVLPEK